MSRVAHQRDARGRAAPSQLKREHHLDEDTYRDTADRLLQKICKEDGMSAARAWVVYEGVHYFGEPSADPANDKPVTRAPKGC